MKLNNLKQPWRYFKVINRMEPISSEEILLIIDSTETTQYQGYSFSFIPNSVVLGLILLFFQSC